MSQPITPGEALKEKNFPDEVVESFNELIVENLKNKFSTFTIENAIEKLYLG